MPLILVVEDSVLVAMAIENVLQLRGLKVVVASTLAAARALIERQLPTAALLDLQLPDGMTLNFALQLHKMGCAVALSSGIKRNAIPHGSEFPAQFDTPVWSDVLAELAGLMTVY